MSLLVVKLVVALVVLCLCRGQVRRRCPDNVVPFAASCLPADLPNGLVSNMTVLRLYCSEGLFERSVQCLSELRASCQDHREQRQLLIQLLDLQAWRMSWESLCDRLHELQEHYACWTMTLQMSAECIQNKMADFRRQVTSGDDVKPSSSLSSSSSSSSLSILSTPRPRVRRKQNTVTLDNLRIYCNASRQILHCFQPALYEFCPFNIAQLLENTYLAFQPPPCQQKESVMSEDGCVTMDTTSVTSSGVKLFHGILVVFAFSVMEFVFDYCDKF